MNTESCKKHSLLNDRINTIYLRWSCYQCRRTLAIAGWIQNDPKLLASEYHWHIAKQFHTTISTSTTNYKRLYQQQTRNFI